MTASQRVCPRCHSPRVDGSAGEDYECATCGHEFPDPFDRDRPRPFQRHGIIIAGRALEALDPDEWPPGGGRHE